MDIEEKILPDEVRERIGKIIYYITSFLVKLYFNFFTFNR